MQNSILLQNVTPEQLQTFINDGIKCQFKTLKSDLLSFDPETLLSRKEACEFLKIDSTTLYHWTKKGKIKAYGIANRRYYKRSELLECLTLLVK